MVKCHVCGSEKFHEDLVTEIFQIDGKFYLVEGIPATVCSHCGEESFSRETTEHIRLMLHSDVQPIKSISVDVLAYQPQLKAS
ncbi:MAG: YgiT-type zinc finger protein [Spirulina sp.]